MTKKIARAPRVTREVGTDDRVDVGRWYWVKRNEEGKPFDTPWLGCVVHVGSNYAQLEDPGAKYGSYEQRVHFDVWAETCEWEPGAQAAIADKINMHRENVVALMQEVRDLTARLGVSQRGALPEPEAEGLVRATGLQPVKDYKADLAKAKDTTLPALFERIKEENERMAAWMKAQLLPLQAEADMLKHSIRAVEARIFSVELYAGLVEEIVQVADGAPAGEHERTHLFQRRCYMDEECLAKYRAGGMGIEGLAGFDRWIAEPENRDRLLPFPRCIVAFRVRRFDKEYEIPSLLHLLRMAELQKHDKRTFLYIRNGDRLYRMETEIDFGPKLFPDMNAEELHGSVYACVRDLDSIGKSHEREGVLISEHRYRDMVESERRDREAYERKLKSTPKKDRWRVYMPSRFRSASDYRPWTPDDVYYDDISAAVARQLEQHNRIVLILQGLFDRSPVLHPHPPVQLWTHGGFERAVELVYDESRALVPGAAPDFEAYRLRLNASLSVGSVTVGQDDYWAEREAERINQRNARSYNRGRTLNYKRYRPYGNPGPSRLARVVRMVRGSKGGCQFEWWRARARGWRSERNVRDTIVVPFNRLLNADAYTPGDFRQFYDDPRTRASYLKWAPYLLECEEYKAGNLTLEQQEEASGNEYERE